MPAYKTYSCQNERFVPVCRHLQKSEELWRERACHGQRIGQLVVTQAGSMEIGVEYSDITALLY